MIKDVEGEWKAVHLLTHSEVIAYHAHEPHEGCTGNLVVLKIDGHEEIRKAIAALLARSPSMLALLEKALPIIEEEAERREAVPRSMTPDDPYWREMRQLANTIQAEIAKAKGDAVIDAELCPHGFGFVEYCPDCTEKEVRAKWREKEDSHG